MPHGKQHGVLMSGQADDYRGRSEVEVAGYLRQPGMCPDLTHPFHSLQGPQSRLKTTPAAVEASCGDLSCVMDK